MDEKQAIRLYKSWDASEKLFRVDKSFLANGVLRVASQEAADDKIFIGFIALIIRYRIYTALKDKVSTMIKKPNYFTVPAAIRELVKIELCRHLDNVYRMDHTVTKAENEAKNFQRQQNMLARGALVAKSLEVHIGIIPFRKGRSDMFILKLIAKIALLQMLLVLLTLRILVKISLNLSSIVAGGLILIVFSCLVYVIIKARWTDVLILGMMEAAIVVVTFGAAMIDGLLDMASDSLGSFFLS